MKKKLFNKIAIVGVGLIGGSIGLAVKKAGLAGKVIGIGRHKEKLLAAKETGVIDEWFLDFSVLSTVDLVVLSMPVDAVMKESPLVKKYIRDDCLVFDVASTKQEIVRLLDKIFPNYVGAHPLAGSEKKGAGFARADMFRDSLCILTPAKNTRKENISRVKKLWELLGAKVEIVSSKEHDRILSFTSHLPHVAAFSLANTVAESFLKFTSTGFRDTTRIAASDYKLWGDIFLSNRDNVLKAIELFEENIRKVKSAIAKNDRVSLDKLLRKANEKRKRLIN